MCSLRAIAVLAQLLLFGSPWCSESFHLTAAYFAVEFFDVLERINKSTPLRVLEVGSRNVNGGVRDFSPVHWNYVGVDIQKGPGVDVVLEDPYVFPFPNANFDAVISSFAFEHVHFFWLTFLEMLRVVRNEGHVFIMAPSNLVDHGAAVPPDSWRFYRDAGKSLELWGLRNGYGGLRLEQSFVAGPVTYQPFEDTIMIFTRGMRSLAIASSPAHSFASAYDRVLSAHTCWRSMSEAERSKTFRTAYHGSDMIGLPCWCCYIYEFVAARLRSGVVQESNDAPGMQECWGAQGRTPQKCCPRIWTEGPELSCVRMAQVYDLFYGPPGKIV